MFCDIAHSKNANIYAFLGNAKRTMIGGILKI